MKRLFYRLIQIFGICGFIVLLIPILLSAIPFVIYLLFAIHPMNYINRELKTEMVLSQKAKDFLSAAAEKVRGNRTIH